MNFLSGLVALVTGGSRGIGQAIARRLSLEGADVAITYRSSKESAEAFSVEMEQMGHRVLALHSDAGDEAQTRDAIAKTVDCFGRLDILVNNAGIVTPGRVDELSLETVDRAYAVNVRGAIVAAQAAVSHMKEGGRIINIGSIGSEHMPFAGQATYAMTKGALSSLTRGLARDLGARGITVNTVQPGRVVTDLLRDATGNDFSGLAQATAVGRLGTPDEVAGLVAYLARPEAGYITGTNIRIDGGTSI